MIIHHFSFIGQTGISSKIHKLLMCMYASMMDSLVVPSPFTLDVAKTLFNIRGKRVKYWTKQVVTVKRMYIAWHNADKERYAKYIN